METTNIWNEFSEALKRFIFSKVKNQEITDDVLQEVFIKIHLNHHKIKKQGSVKSWIFTLTNNAIKDYLRAQSKSSSISPGMVELENDLKDEHSAKDCILPLVKNLPPTYKDAILLSEIKGLKQAEVAKILNLSVSGAKSRIQRGRELLKQGFIECCDYTLNEFGHLVGEHKAKKDCKICNPTT